jgi:catechol 2,3-dioxygenase
MAWNYPGALFLAAGGYHHHLGVNTWAGSDAAPAGPDDARLLEWELVLPSSDDIEASAKAMTTAGHWLKRDSEGWSIADPWGTNLRVRSA